MKASTIYRKAAEIVDQPQANFWGYALDKAGQPHPGNDASPLQANMLYEFQMRHSSYDDFGYSNESVIALLFMHEIALDEEGRK